jgi:5-oxopent-3-ene-1,2,5-tricarboxylate decarboxylase/2-hydroxyhepta-2,4-diene-1,7-dioate isomerase
MRKARISLERETRILGVRATASGEIVTGAVGSLDASRVIWHPPTTGQVFGVILNDIDSIAALGAALREPPYKGLPVAPAMYIKPANTHVGHGAAVRWPEGATALDVRGTLGVVIGKAASRVTETAAMQYVGGYTVVTDLAVPHASLYRPAIRETCFDGACPIGPWIVDAEEVGDPSALEVRTFIGGELKYQRSLANLVRPVSRLIADVSDFMRLNAGDVILVGVPVGAPQARAGDTIAVEIPGVGRLENVLLPSSGRAS